MLRLASYIGVLYIFAKELYGESITALAQVGAACPGCFLEEGGIQVGLHHLEWEEEWSLGGGAEE